MTDLDGELPVFLLVEDNPIDQAILRAAFAKADVKLDLHFVDDAETALAYLRRTGDFADPSLSPRPTVVLLDLALPVMEGPELITVVRADPELCVVPILVLTTSAVREDIRRCYAEGCNSYFVKPLEFSTLVSQLRRIYDYWCDMVWLPRV